MMVTECIGKKLNSYHLTFLLHTTTATAIIAIRAITPNVTASPKDKLPVSGDSVCMFGARLASSTVVEAENSNVFFL